MPARRIVLAAVCAAALITGPVANAEDRGVKVINETNFTIVEFYGSNAGSEEWEEDILGQDVLLPGKSVMINFDDGSGYCKFDFLVKFEDGDELERRGIDVCETGVFRIHE